MRSSRMRILSCSFIATKFISKIQLKSLEWPRSSLVKTVPEKLERRNWHGLGPTLVLKTSLTVKDHSLYSVIPYKKKLVKFTHAKAARVFYKNHSIDLLNGKVISGEGISVFLERLDHPINDPEQDLRVMHLFYELGFLFENLESLVSDDDVLAMDIQYTQMSEVVFEKSAPLKLSLLRSPVYDQYERQFAEGYKNLKEGNCYQFNLTGLYEYGFFKKYLPDDFIGALWKRRSKRGAYASATYSSYLDQLFLSNSPECLFQCSGGKLVTRPIKGTFPRKDLGEKELELLWKKLVADKKSEAELYMITDLLRNDLCRIDKPTAKVLKKKAMLLVPGLIHQYSEIEVDLDPAINLKRVVEKLFPGGSITGAPKKRVMGLLFHLEKRSRGFYCGSTLLFRKGLVEASINIRSSIIDFKTRKLSYQAGGGITLLSDAKNEFEEMSYKHDSYIDTLTL